MRKWIYLAAAATAALVWFAPDDDVVVSTAAATPSPSPVHQAESVPAAAPPQALAQSIPPELQIQHRLEDEDAGNLFAGSSAQVEAPLKPAAARATPAETAAAAVTPAASGPALVFLGSYRDGGQTTYLLQADGQDIVARVGDVVQGAYRFDGETDGTLSFTYLPRNQSITLALTHASGEAN